MKKQGFITTIVLAIIAIVLLKVWFGFDVFKWLNTPEIKGFFMKIWNIILLIWDKYLEESFNSLLTLIKDTVGSK